MVAVLQDDRAAAAANAASMAAARVWIGVMYPLYPIPLGGMGGDFGGHPEQVILER